MLAMSTIAVEAKSDNNDIPNWFCPYKIPVEFVGSLPPLVYLAGLNVDKNQVHRGIWEMIKLKPSTKDFQPTYVDVPLDHKFPVKKQKNDQIESYVPRGILKSNWLNKHLQLVPSVIVTFFDMNWTDPFWNDKKNECAKRVRELKTDLAPHGTQILVMLIKTADAGEDNFSTDRASALCAAADIPPKALYILSHTHSERIQACVQRLEIGMKEASKVYYAGRIRRVKNWKDRTQDPALLTRYNFKTGFLQEIRRDYVSALSHYHAAHEMLRSMKVTESNVQQIRCASSWVNYRICRLNLLKMDYKESQSQFDKHIQALRNIEGSRELAFEQLAWVQTQYSIFGELLRHFYRPMLTSLDPVTYFLAAVDLSEKRMRYCKEFLINSGVEWPEEMNEYQKDCDVEYIGQRPWRGDAFGPDTVFVPEDSNAIQALKFLELKYKNSDDRITHLGIASDFCRDQKRLRTRCQLMMMMGIEFFSEGEYHRAIMLMTHVLREFGRDKGTALLYHVAECGLRAACCDGDVSSYLSFLVFMLKRDFDTFVPSKRRELLWCKLLAVLDKRIPMAEQGCVPNEEKWNTNLATPYVSYVGVHRECIVDAVFYFNSETVRACTPSEVRVVLVNKVDFPIPISKVGVGISITDYNCDDTNELILKPDETRELSLFFTPTLKDVGKIIQIHLGYIDIGKPNASIILHYSAVMGINPYLWNDGKKEKGKQIIAKIEPMVPLLRPKITRDDPMLVNEWHKVLVSWTNTDTYECNKVHVNILVATSDPSDIILTTTPHNLGKYGGLTHSMDVEQLEPNGTIDAVVYIRCTKPRTTEFQIVTKVKYVDHMRQAVVNELYEPIELIKPFEVTQKFRNLETDDVGNVLPNEEVLLYLTLKNASKTSLHILSAKVTNLLPVVEPTVKPTLELSDVTVQEGNTVQLVNSMILTGPAEGALGCLEICWRRESEPDAPSCTTIIGLNPISVSLTAAIYIEGIFNYKGRGLLKMPMPIKYSIHNRSYKVYDLWISLDSTECFMNAGPKKTNIKIMPMESVDMHYILFPLKTGLLKTPKLLIDNTSSSAAGDSQLDSASIVHKNVVKYIFVARAGEEGV